MQQKWFIYKYPLSIQGDFLCSFYYNVQNDGGPLSLFFRTTNPSLSGNIDDNIIYKFTTPSLIGSGLLKFQFAAGGEWNIRINNELSSSGWENISSNLSSEATFGILYEGQNQLSLSSLNVYTSKKPSIWVNEPYVPVDDTIGILYTFDGLELSQQDNFSLSGFFHTTDYTQYSYDQNNVYIYEFPTMDMVSYVDRLDEIIINELSSLLGITTVTP